MGKLSPFWIINFLHVLYFFRFCLLCCIQESVGHCLWGNQHHDTIHFSKNLEMAYCIDWRSPWKPQYKDFWVSGCQSEDCFKFMKTKPTVQSTLWCLVVVTRDGEFRLSFIFPQRLNTGANIKCLEDIVLPWPESVAAGRPPFKQQNFKPCHTSRRI